MIRRRPLALLAVLFGLLLLPSAAGAVVLGELTDPTPGATPRGLAAAPDGVAWFTDPGAGRIGRLGADDVVRGFDANVARTATATTAPPALTPDRIAVGPDGALWYSIQEGGIARMTTAGVVTRYATRIQSRTAGIAAGPDGAVWFTMPDAGLLGRVTAPTDDQVAGGSVRGRVSTYATDLTGSNPDDIALGTDGALWFTEPGSNTIGRALPTAQAPQITHTALPTAGGAPSRLTVGPDGQIWFSAPGTGRIGRLTATGQIVELPLPAGSGAPGDVTAAPDGALWVAETSGPAGLLRVGADGTTTRTVLPDPQGAPVELVRGTDGPLRYTRSRGRIGRVDTLAAAVEQPVLPPVTPRAIVPVAGRTVILEAVSGTIRIRRPGSRTFEPLPADGSPVPDGTEIDARAGRVRLTAETAPGSGVTRTAIFWDGRFVVRQARVAGAATEVRLSGPLACGANVSQALPRAASKKRRKPKVGRRLWGDGKGEFRTRGARATASVRGTRWLVEDRCDKTTRVRVFVGIVDVRDRSRKRRVTITAGEQYVAPGPRRR